MADVYVYDLNEPTSLSDNDFVLVNIGTGLQKIKFSILKQAINNVLSQSDKEKIGAIIINGDSTKFLDNSGNYRAIKQQDISDLALPIASQSILGGVKVDGTTITVAEDGTISGASIYELPVATNTTLGGVKIDNDTIKINEGVISADVIGNWSAGTIYPVGYFVVYEDKLYQCINANSDSEWVSGNWSLIGGSGSSATETTINNWSTSTDYIVGDLVINGTTLYQCNTEHTSGEAFDDTEAINWTVLSGAQGEKGDDGISPTATIIQTETGATISITDGTGTSSANILNGVNGNDGITPHIDEATKHWFVGDIDTGVKAEGVTTIMPTSANYTGILSVDNWTGDSAPYTQSVAIGDINADLSPFIDLIVSDDIITGAKEQSQWSYITKVVTGDGEIIFSCYENKPTINMNFKVKVI